MNAAIWIRGTTALMMGLAMGAPGEAADVAAGKARSEACSACHGGNGVSTGPGFPHLAGQTPVYLAAQLKAYRAETRKHPIMHAMATQLSDADIDNIAAYFASLTGAPSGAAKSPVPPALAATKVSFPADYKGKFTYYTTINFEATKQVRLYYANAVALAAARDGKPLPDGSVLLVSIHTAKLGDDKMPMKGADGFFAPDKLVGFTAMARQAGWGKDIPAMLRNEDWSYAVFAPDGKPRPGLNYAVCFACHKPLDKVSYLFTLKALTDKAKAK